MSANGKSSIDPQRGSSVSGVIAQPVQKTRGIMRARCFGKASTRRWCHLCTETIGMFAELERAVIRECVMSGLARARAHGKNLGRKRTDRTIEKRIERALARGGRGIRKI